MFSCNFANAVGNILTCLLERYGNLLFPQTGVRLDIAVELGVSFSCFDSWLSVFWYLLSVLLILGCLFSCLVFVSCLSGYLLVVSDCFYG